MHRTLLFYTLALTSACPTSISNFTPLATDSTPLIPSDAAAETCKNVQNYKTAVGITTSSLQTLAACLWLATHSNIPGAPHKQMARTAELLKIMVAEPTRKLGKAGKRHAGWTERPFLKTRECHTKHLNLFIIYGKRV